MPGKKLSFAILLAVLCHSAVTSSPVLSSDYWYYQAQMNAMAYLDHKWQLYSPFLHIPQPVDQDQFRSRYQIDPPPPKIEDGLHQEFHATGQLLKEYTYEDGRRHGPLKEFYANGALKKEGQYDKGMPTGLFKEYYLSGKPYMEKIYGSGPSVERMVVYYDNGQEMTVLLPEGLTAYYQDGTVKEKITFAENFTLHGTRTAWHKDGKIAFEARYDKGAIAGAAREYFDNGNLKTEVFDTANATATGNNQEVVLMKGYYDTGPLMKEVIFRNGVQEVIHYDPKGKTYRALPNSLFDYNGQINPYHLQQGQLLNGKYEQYGSNGKKLSEGEFRNNQAHGEFKEFHPNGNLKSKKQFKKGQLDGLWADYNADGLLISEKEHRYGLLDGTFRQYDGFGRLLREQNYRTGQLHGLEREYNNNGVLARELFYENGRPNEPLTMYDAEGYLMSDSKCAQNSCQHRQYFRDGTLQGEYSTKNGRMEGDARSYFPGGALCSESHFKNGLSEGLVRIFETDGYLFQTMEYKDGLYHGHTKEYWNSEHEYKEVPPEGQLRSDINFVAGKRDGVAKYYDQDGRLTKEEVYENDVLVSEKTYPHYLSALDRTKSRVKLKSVSPDPAVTLNVGDTVTFDFVFEYELAEPNAEIPVYLSKELEDGDFFSLSGYISNGALLLSFSRYDEYKLDRKINPIDQGKGEVRYQKQITIPETTQLKVHYGIYAVNEGDPGHLEKFFYKVEDPGKPPEEKKTYYANGKVQRVSPYEKGRKHGIEKMYDAFGNLLSEVEYKDGKAMGVVRSYFPNGKLRLDLDRDDEGRVRKGYRQYFADGTIQMDAVIDGDLITETAYNEAGNRVSVVTRKVDPSIQYHDYWLTYGGGYYSGGHMVGIAKNYDQDGSLSGETFYGDAGHSLAYATYRTAPAYLSTSIAEDFGYYDQPGAPCPPAGSGQ